MKQARLAVAPIVIAVTLAIAAPAQPETWQADVSVSYLRGTYGDEATTSIVTAPLTLKRFFRRCDASVSFPLVSVRTRGDALLVDGTPHGAADGDGKGTVSGLGDVVVKGKYYALEERGNLPSLDLAGRVKLPTAADGLGTGEPDAGIGVELVRRIGAKHLVLADAMYTLIGDPPGVDYRNRISWDVGVGWQPSAGATIALYYDYRSPLRASQGAERSALLYASRRLRPGLRWYGMLEIGLTEAAGDLGLTGGVKFGF